MLFHQRESKLPTFSSRNPPSASSLLRWLYGGLVASSEFFVRSHCFWSYSSEEEQRIREGLKPLSLLYLPGQPLFITPHLPLNLPRTKHWPHSNGLHQKKEDSSSPFPHNEHFWFTDLDLQSLGPFVYLSYLQRLWCCRQIAPHFLCRLLIPNCWCRSRVVLHYLERKTLKVFSNEKGKFGCLAYCWLSSVQES